MVSIAYSLSSRSKLGGVRPSDVSLIDTVLQTVHDDALEHCVIVNRVSSRLMKKVSADTTGSSLAQLMVALNSGTNRLHTC